MRKSLTIAFLIHWMFFVCACAPSDSELRLRSENSNLSKENNELKQRLEEKEAYIHTALRFPDKLEFDAIERDYRENRADPALESKYGNFIRRYPDSPLSQNATKRVSEITARELKENQRREEKSQRDLIPVVEIDEFCHYPERYIGKTIRVKGNIKRSTTDYRHFPYGPYYYVSNSKRGFGAFFASNGLSSSLDRTLQGHTARQGINCDLKIAISRDANLNLIVAIWDYLPINN